MLEEKSNILNKNQSLLYDRLKQVSSRNSKLIWLSFTSFYLGIILTLILIFSNNDKIFAYSLVFIAVILAILPFILNKANQKLDLAEFIYPFTIYYSLGYGGRQLTLSLGFIEDYGYLQLAGDYDQFINTAFLYSCIGLIFWIIGYKLQISTKIAQNLPKLKFELGEQPDIKRIFILIFIGWFGQILVFNSNRAIISQENVYSTQDRNYDATKVGIFDYIIIYISSITTIVLALCLVYYFSAQTKHKLIIKFIIFCILIPTILLNVIITGEKFTLITIFFYFYIAYYYSGRRIKLSLIIIIILLSIFIIFPFINVYRQGDINAGSYSTNPVDQFTTYAGVSADILFSKSLQDYITNSLATILSRSHLLDSFALTIRYTDINGYRLGSEYLPTLIYSFIPRFILNDKPTGEGALVGRTIFGIEGNNTSLILGQAADLYWDFGLIGMAIGMFLLGSFMRIIYFYLIKCNENEKAGLFLYLLTFTFMLHASEQLVYTLPGKFLREILLWYVILLFLNKKKFNLKKRIRK